MLNEVEKGGVALLGSQREKAHFQVVRDLLVHIQPYQLRVLQTRELVSILLYLIRKRKNTTICVCVL